MNRQLGPEHTGHFVQPHVAAHCGGDIYSRRKPLFSSFGEHTAVCGSSVRQAVARPRHRQSVCIHNIHVALVCSGPPQCAATCGWTKWPVCSGPYSFLECHATNLTESIQQSNTFHGPYRGKYLDRTLPSCWMPVEFVWFCRPRSASGHTLLCASSLCILKGNRVCPQVNQSFICWDQTVGSVFNWIIKWFVVVNWDLLLNGVTAAIECWDRQVQIDIFTLVRQKLICSRADIWSRVTYIAWLIFVTFYRLLSSSMVIINGVLHEIFITSLCQLLFEYSNHRVILKRKGKKVMQIFPTRMCNGTE